MFLCRTFDRSTNQSFPRGENFTIKVAVEFSNYSGNNSTTTGYSFFLLFTVICILEIKLCLTWTRSLFCSYFSRHWVNPTKLLLHANLVSPRLPEIHDLETIRLRRNAQMHFHAATLSLLLSRIESVICNFQIRQKLDRASGGQYAIADLSSVQKERERESESFPSCRNNRAISGEGEKKTREKREENEDN